MLPSLRPVATALALVAALLLHFQGWTASAQTAKPPARKAAESTGVPAPTPLPAGKPGGTLNVMLREDLAPGFAIHESATISTVFPSSPCFSNLVMFDPATPVESMDSVVPELAEKWSWQDNYRNLVFFLKKNDPDANFYENFACSSPRNYGGYCSELVTKMIEQQSQELDPAKRLGQVVAIQKQLEQDAARPTLDSRLDYFTVWPHVKNLVPHHNIFNFGRMQEVWRDK